MALLPLSALFEGDVLELLIAHHVVGRRVAAQDVPIRLRHNGRVLDPQERIGAAGVAPLDHVEAFYA
jgi:toluene monooxygenase system protein B